MPDVAKLKSIEPVVRPSLADQVFDALYAQVLSTDLPPGAKLSEADVAQKMDVSRQSVRDAFYRLSQLGFLVIRPQRATTVSLISAKAISRARYIRTALEVENLRHACTDLTDDHLDALGALLDQQQAALDAGDKSLFHELDDQFHRQICEFMGLGFAWDSIRENKAHTDRVRLLSLSFASQRALDEHVEVLNALRNRDSAAAEAAIRHHLGKIEDIVAQIRADNHDWFAEE